MDYLTFNETPIFRYMLHIFPTFFVFFKLFISSTAHFLCFHAFLEVLHGQPWVFLLLFYLVAGRRPQLRRWALQPKSNFSWSHLADILFHLDGGLILFIRFPSSSGQSAHESNFFSTVRHGRALCRHFISIAFQNLCSCSCLVTACFSKVAIANFLKFTSQENNPRGFIITRQGARCEVCF